VACSRRRPVPREQRAGRPRASQFVFARLRYESGDWDDNPKVAANVLDSIIDWRNKRFLRDDNTKFAINIVVYAMA
jgi:hypothetical protein